MITLTEDVEKLQVKSNGKNRRRIPNHAILPPKLSEILLDPTEIKITDLIQVIADRLRKKIIQKKSKETRKENDVEDQRALEEESESSFLPILIAVVLLTLLIAFLVMKRKQSEE